MAEVPNVSLRERAIAMTLKNIMVGLLLKKPSQKCLRHVGDFFLFQGRGWKFEDKCNCRQYSYSYLYSSLTYLNRRAFHTVTK